MSVCRAISAGMAVDQLQDAHLCCEIGQGKEYWGDHRDSEGKCCACPLGCEGAVDGGGDWGYEKQSLEILHHILGRAVVG